MDSFKGYTASSDAQRAITYSEFEDALIRAESAFWGMFAHDMRDAGVIGADLSPMDAEELWRTMASAAWQWLGCADLTPERRAELCGYPEAETVTDRLAILNTDWS